MSAALEARIDEWRGYVERARAIRPGEAEELEGHLREQIDALREAGLDEDEAFLVGVRRLGAIDAISREFARSNSARLWKQLLPSTRPERADRRERWTTAAYAVAAAVLVLAIELATLGDSRAIRFPLLAPSAALGVLAAWLLQRRSARWRARVLALAWIAVPTLVVLAYTFVLGGDALSLAGIHLPVFAWFGAGVAYLAGRGARRAMEFVRFSGEFAIYYVLIALGGGVLVALLGGILQPLLPGAVDALARWWVPPLAAGAVVVAAWLVEAKQSVIENLAPVLAAVFTPLFAVAAVVAAAVYGVAGLGAGFDRDLLIAFDVLLLIVTALGLYRLSARDPRRPTGVIDVAALVATLGSLALDVIELWSLASRVGELGWTANRVAALGLNLLLVVVLVGAAILGIRMLATRGTSAPLERWHTSALPAYAAWALLVAIALPPLFGTT